MTAAVAAQALVTEAEAVTAGAAAVAMVVRVEKDLETATEVALVAKMVGRAEPAFGQQPG